MLFKIAHNDLRDRAVFDSNGVEIPTGYRRKMLAMLPVYALIACGCWDKLMTIDNYWDFNKFTEITWQSYSIVFLLGMPISFHTNLQYMMNIKVLLAQHNQSYYPFHWQPARWRESTGRWTGRWWSTPPSRESLGWGELWVSKNSKLLFCKFVLFQPHHIVNLQTVVWDPHA